MAAGSIPPLTHAAPPRLTSPLPRYFLVQARSSRNSQGRRPNSGSLRRRACPSQQSSCRDVEQLFVPWDTPAGIVALIATGHGATVAAGLLAGGLLAAAAAAVRTISAYLYGVTAYATGTWGLAAAVVVAAAAVGALVPALRAGAVSPVEALRAE